MPVAERLHQRFLWMGETRSLAAPSGRSTAPETHIAHLLAKRGALREPPGPSSPAATGDIGGPKAGREANAWGRFAGQGDAGHAPPARADALQDGGRESVEKPGGAYGHQPGLGGGCDVFESQSEMALSGHRHGSIFAADSRLVTGIHAHDEAHSGCPDICVEEARTSKQYHPPHRQRH